MSPARALVSDITADVMEPYIGRTFVFEGAWGQASMELIEVRRLKRYAESPRDPFALLFVMRGQSLLGRGLPRLVHADFEAIDIFLQRVTVPERERADPAGMFYEAVFN